MNDLPWTPDFDFWPVEHDPAQVKCDGDVLSITWSDGKTSAYHALLLRENSPDPTTIHPKAREMCMSPTEIDPELTLSAARIEANGAIAARPPLRTTPSCCNGLRRCGTTASRVLGVCHSRTVCLKRW